LILARTNDAYVSLLNRACKADAATLVAKATLGDVTVAFGAKAYYVQR